MRIHIENKFFKIELKWWEKILACRGSLEIPIGNIKTVSGILPQYDWKTTIRCPGTGFPSLISAGTFYVKREKWDKEFFYWTRGKKFLVLDLENESFRRIVVGVENPAFWIHEMEKAKSI